MTTNHHTPIVFHSPADAETFNAPMAQLDQELTSQAAAIGTANSNIGTLQGQMSTANSNIGTLQGQMSTAQGDLITLDALIDLMANGIPPLGRLTLQSGKPIPDAPVSAAGAIYFSPYLGNLAQLGGVAFSFAEMSLNIASVLAGSAYDVFLCYQNVEGVITRYIGYGPAWATVNSRGTGVGTTELVLKNGVWVNKVAMYLTCGAAETDVTVGAEEAKYLGSFLATANGQTSDNATLGYLYNAYNQVERQNFLITANEHEYTTDILRNWGGTDETKLQVFFGLPGQRMSAHLIALSGGHAYIGIDFYASNDFALLPGYSSGSDLFQTLSMDAVARLGQEFVVATEQGNGTTGYFSSANIRLSSMR